jgi:uncharacterized protein (DUF4415 family)
MKDPNLKVLSEEEEAEIQREFDKGFDFSKALRKGIYINLDEEVIQYFKALSAETGRGYQTLIQDALMYFKEKKLKPKTIWK